MWPRDCGSLTIWLFTAACEGPILWIFPRPTTDHSPPLPARAAAADAASASDDVKSHFVCFVPTALTKGNWRWRVADGSLTLAADSASASDDVKYHFVCFVHVDGGCSVHADFVLADFVRVDGGSPQGAGGREGPPPAN